ncbi:MTH1187 family thiamine-binding protein [Caldisericum exile]|uniref:Thiamine-binding protein domain-containing protein n=1 Tax=Caldisericum exile (strain DSM 21853 / NBRC 104410 / AZM16c01) TaxID=511051 RepID=A0A7U6JFU9_CALEA|nr:MTH1187 family thiamine-binding protein [Caldisericum exile]BAL80630.1 hypothetical protein CSE_05040 [Caldisericum exile AZM16c01]
MAIAEFTVIPAVPEDEIYEIVDEAIKVVIDSGLKYEVSANSTTIEGDLDTLLEVIKKAHIVARDKGSGRVFTVIKIDDKKNGVTIEEKVKKYRK